MTSSTTSSPRAAGRQCMNFAVGAASAMSSGVTWYVGKKMAMRSSSVSSAS